METRSPSDPSSSLNSIDEGHFPIGGLTASPVGKPVTSNPAPLENSGPSIAGRFEEAEITRIRFERLYVSFQESQWLEPQIEESMGNPTGEWRSLKILWEQRSGEFRKAIQSRKAKQDDESSVDSLEGAWYPSLEQTRLILPEGPGSSGLPRIEDVPLDKHLGESDELKIFEAPNSENPLNALSKSDRRRHAEFIVITPLWADAERAFKTLEKVLEMNQLEKNQLEAMVKKRKEDAQLLDGSVGHGYSWKLVNTLELAIGKQKDHVADLPNKLGDDGFFESNVERKTKDMYAGLAPQITDTLANLRKKQESFLGLAANQS